MKNSEAKKKVALVYDWLDSWGGVERVLQQLLEILPEADLYTAHWDKEKTKWLGVKKARTSFMQKLPSLVVRNRIVSLLLYPYAFESFDFSEYDIVISVTSSFAKSIITKPKTTHICYVLTPTRFLWSGYQQYTSSFTRFIAAPQYSAMRQWDLVASQRPDTIISISQTVAQRCNTFYRRNSEVLYPGIDTDYWDIIKRNNNSQTLPKSIQKPYFLIVSRLVKYKDIEYAIKAFTNEKKYAVVVVGTGTEEKRLKTVAPANVQFLGLVTDEQLSLLYSNAQALIMPQEEDFGLVALEAQYHNCPVIAYNRGGATETVIDGKTGILYDQQTEDGLLKGIARFHTVSYNEKHPLFAQLPEQGQQFTKKAFQKNWQDLLHMHLGAHSF